MGSKGEGVVRVFFHIQSLSSHSQKYYFLKQVCSFPPEVLSYYQMHGKREKIRLSPGQRPSENIAQSSSRQQGDRNHLRGQMTGGEEEGGERKRERARDIFKALIIKILKKSKGESVNVSGPPRGAERETLSE